MVEPLKKFRSLSLFRPIRICVATVDDIDLSILVIPLSRVFRWLLIGCYVIAGDYSTVLGDRTMVKKILSW